MAHARKIRVGEKVSCLRAVYFSKNKMEDYMFQETEVAYCEYAENKTGCNEDVSLISPEIVENWDFCPYCGRIIK